MNTDIEIKLNEVTSLISLPEVYIKVNRLMENPNSDMYKFAEVVMVDSGLSALILKMVNSAYFGFPETIQNIAQSISLIGLDRFHQIVLGVSAMSCLKVDNQDFSLEQFWRSSLSTGVMAQLLATRMDAAENDEMFIAGLLHEIGRLILYAHFPELAVETATLAKERNVPIQEAELELMGCHYGEIGATLMAKWKLPEELQTLTHNQPFPLEAGEDQQNATLMHVAHIYGQNIAGNKIDVVESLVSDDMLSILGILREELCLDMEDAESMSREMAKVILH
ncbi:MAG: HD-like signal output (HDOD) protein [Candidatus Azotimanducaceae bacterium]|jgi:HD-like signal output (HDOD) protein